MTKEEVRIGVVYNAKVSDKIVPVRIDAERPFYGGWTATNLETNREVIIRTAARLRSKASSRCGSCKSCTKFLEGRQVLSEAARNESDDYKETCRAALKLLSTRYACTSPRF